MHPLGKLSKKERKKLQDELVSKVEIEIQLNLEYMLLLVTATIIATLGILNNNSVVVIGAMIISPLFWPILGIVLAIITSKKRLIRKAFFSFIASFVITIFISAIVTFVFPIKTLTNEILIRTNPTLIDIIIALATSVIGVAAMYYPGISSSSTGVALSISLIPPLCVVGIGSALGNLEVFSNSLILFAGNVGAIIFAGVLTLFLLKFRPHKKEEVKTFRLGLFMSGVFLFFLSIPLGFYLYDTVQETNLKTDITNTLTTEIHQISSDIEIDDIRIQLPTNLEHEEIKITATVHVPGEINISSNRQNRIIQAIQTQTNNNVDLQINIIETLVIK
ncbi:TIGR00341 family protein [Candidatus Dojkabacteria bacterium]|nr:TIGR00341 family protein [Candidatus Dojkabacteria bacterium]